VTSRLDLRTLALLAVGVLAVSLAAPLMAALVVPPLAIAFWRNALATAAIAPVVGWQATHPDMRMSQEGSEHASPAARATCACPGTREVLLVAGAGACLAAHFGFWITSLTMTSVASSTAIVSLQVLWVVGYDVLRGAEARAQVLLGVVLAVAGAVVVSGVDLSISSRALAGDGLALLGSVGVAAYAVIGGRARQTLTTSVYTLGCYGTAAALLLVATLLSGQALTGYDADQWLRLGVLAATAQLLGHSVFNHLLATVSPMVVSLTILLEIPGASLIAAAWLGQVPGPTAFAGLALILAGMAVVILSAPPSVEGEAVVA
jgi:drug/metabolite transporter (DMT)-like permease